VHKLEETEVQGELLSSSLAYSPRPWFTVGA
jgi:hypothetical protein